MKTQNKYVQGLIDYLETRLCNHSNLHQFTKVGPRSFFYSDPVDTIFVKITDKNLIIITDGENVIGQELMYRCPNSNGSNLTEDDLYNDSLQDILSLF